MKIAFPTAAVKRTFSKQRLKELFTRRSFKAGGYTALACVAAIAIAAVVVVAVQTLPNTWTELDISSEGTTTISDDTKELLGLDTIMHKTCYFVFRDNVIQAVKNKFKDLKREYNVLKKSDTVSTSEFELLVKSRESYPYQCENDLNKIKTQLLKSLEKDGTSGFIDTVTFWIDKARNYKYRYNLDEYREIVDVVRSVWMSFREEQGTQLQDDDELYVEMTEEDNPELKGTVL